MDRQAVCPHCGTTFSYAQYHAGFGDQGFMYCSDDEAVFVWDVYGPGKYLAIAGHKLPWTLSIEERTEVEAHVRPCPYGGTFSFKNPPRCPVCHSDISAVVPGGIYYVVTGREVDGNDPGRWQCPETRD